MFNKRLTGGHLITFMDKSVIGLIREIKSTNQRIKNLGDVALGTKHLILVQIKYDTSDGSIYTRNMLKPYAYG